MDQQQYNGPERRQENWYNNKELFELLLDLERNLSSIQLKLVTYNGLHDKIDALNVRLTSQEKICTESQGHKEGKKDAANTIRQYWPLIMSTILFLVTIYTVVIK